MRQWVSKSTISSAAGLALLTACGTVDDGSASDDELLEQATLVAALNAGDGEDLDGVPDGDVDGTATEAVDGELATEPEVHGDCSLSAVRNRVRARYDEDGDGRLSEEERNALREDLGESPTPRHRMRRHAAMRHWRLRQLVWVYDADRSRDLDDAERQELKNDLEQRCEVRRAQILDRFDADQSGDLNEDELAAARQALRERMQARRQALLDRFDNNGDGTLDESERLAARRAAKERIAQRRKALVEQFDADGNGVLSASERDNLREWLKERVRGEHLSVDAI